MDRARRIGPTLGGLVLVALTLVGCEGGGGQAAGEAEVRQSQASGGGGGGSGGSQAFASLGAAGRQASAAALPSLRATIVKTARVEIEVARNRLQDAVQDATTTAGDFGGFVVTTSIDAEGFRSGTLILRVPADSFEDALADIENLGEVEDKSVTGQDVSQELIDLDARLRNWRAQEGVLLQLMDRARTIGQTIRVQNELQTVQLEIERIRGRLRFLDDQTALSTIHASFVATGVAPASKPNVIERAAEQAVDIMLSVVAALIVSLGVLIPAAILILVGLLIYKQLRPRLTP